MTESKLSFQVFFLFPSFLCLGSLFYRRPRSRNKLMLILVSEHFSFDWSHLLYPMSYMSLWLSGAHGLVARMVCSRWRSPGFRSCCQYFQFSRETGAQSYFFLVSLWQVKWKTEEKLWPGRNVVVAQWKSERLVIKSSWVQMPWITFSSNFSFSISVFEKCALK